MKHLFIDDHGIERLDNLARKLHQPQKFRGNAIVRPEYRWENLYIRMWGAPMWDPDAGLFKMIYLGSASKDLTSAGKGAAAELDETGESGTSGHYSCYATSEDGVNWEKPFLELYDYPGLNWNGSPIGGQNNILPSITGHLRGPVYHAAETDPARRFKTQAYRQGNLYTLVSADCVHWEELDLPPQPSADVSELYLDEVTETFISTVKHRGPYGRSFYLSTSKDFQNWSEQALIFHADQTDQENGAERTQRFFDDLNYLTPVYNRPEEWRTDVYHFPVFRYEGFYLGLPVMHHWTGKHPPLYENVDSRKTVELASSRDLRNWKRVADRAAFMELSPVGDGGAYDTGQIGTTNGVVRRNNELWFYYTAMKFRSQTIAETLNHGYLDASALAIARLRLDGFVSLKGGIEWGSVLTKPVQIDGSELRVNANSWRGRVKAELLDPDEKKPLPGYGVEECIPVMVDHIDEPMRWQGKADLCELQGKSVRIRFSLWQSELYAYWFAGSK